jgi:hypothetical protein
MSTIDGLANPPLTEPIFVQCLFITGTHVDAGDGYVRVIGWSHIPQMGGETEERRIAVRFSMPIDTAKELEKLLRRAHAKRGH